MGSPSQLIFVQYLVSLCVVKVRVAMEPDVRMVFYARQCFQVGIATND
jgi:hypothetical protein